MPDMEFLKNFPFFEHLNEQELEDIAAVITTKVYNKGVNLFWENEEGNELFIIQSGAVKIFRHQEGREIILALFREGDFFGEMVLFGDDKVRSASANTLEKTTVYILKKEHFLQLLNKNPNIFIKILNTALERLRQANEQIANLSMTSAYARIARLLVRLTQSPEADRVIGLKLTHHQMADMTATARETVTKVLSDMQGKGYIRIVNRQIHITDPEGLMTAAGIE